MSVATSRRGRPPLNRPNKDFGTPELQIKRQSRLTSEIIDLYLEKGIITQQQHWCGIHMRWLHTIRFGAPSVKALDTTHNGGAEIYEDDADWLAAREEEHAQAYEALKQAEADQVIIEACVYNNDPLLSRRNSFAAYQQLMHGFDALEKLWCD